MAIINLSAANFLSIRQSDTEQNNHIHEVVSQALIVAQIVRCSKQLIDSLQLMNVGQAVALSKTSNLSVSNTLALSQIMGPTRYLFASNVLRLTQVGANVNPQSPLNGLIIRQTVLASRAFNNKLTVTQALASTKTAGRTTSQALSLISQVVVYKVDGVDTYGITVPNLVDSVPIILTHGSESITLKIPEIGDGDKIEVSRVQVLTRGGDLIVYADPVWPKTETLKFKFIGLSRLLSGELLNFLADTIGLQISLIDYQGQSWLGIITTPEAQRRCVGDNNCGTYEVEFEFEGVKA